MTIRPKVNCKLCSSTGQIMFWDSKKQGTYYNGNEASKRPCMCLVKQFQKLGTPTEPQFEEEDGKVVIKFEKIVEIKEQ